MIVFYLGGLLATAIAAAAEGLHHDREVDPLVLVMAALWPVALPWLLLEAIKDARS